jgi:hypothetical protein
MAIALHLPKDWAKLSRIPVQWMGILDYMILIEPTLIILGILEVIYVH